jgi:hypothetical protein
MTHEEQMVHTRHTITTTDIQQYFPLWHQGRVLGRKHNRSQVSVARRRQLAARRRLLTSQVFRTDHKGLVITGSEIGDQGMVFHVHSEIICPKSTWQCGRNTAVSILGIIVCNLWSYLKS